ncbi:hypothetical protein [Virgisporangium aurantiacum]|uniref:Secreted protein n=1 Tax=Virgisporangium aurantiacum TaxID=175570 RepID=A0A8J3ZGE1_9ACTN|nr:hypothetical protein [Virgisporangium aurantiacum]GIJ63632.1 hypothetical protein Vau01_111480 [Virgisporangium aurantiacum]
MSIHRRLYEGVAALGLAAALAFSGPAFANDGSSTDAHRDVRHASSSTQGSTIQAWYVDGFYYPWIICYWAMNDKIAQGYPVEPCQNSDYGWYFRYWA